MSDNTPMPASGQASISDASSKGAPDGVSATPTEGDGRSVHGRTEGGESGGANYLNPQTGKAGASGSGFSEGATGHGGQTQIDYYGSGQRGAGGASGENAVAGSNSSDHAGETKAPAPTAERPSHQVTAQGRTFTVVEDSGVAAAEAAGDLRPGSANDSKDCAKAG